LMKIKENELENRLFKKKKWGPRSTRTSNNKKERTRTRSTKFKKWKKKPKSRMYENKREGTRNRWFKKK
jgi:hypothetical protein